MRRSCYKWFLPLFFIIFLSFPTRAYTNSLIQGRVIDLTTKQPLHYATVSIPKEGIGITTNQLGEFKLHVPANCMNDILQISFIGYESKMLKISSLKMDSIYVFEMNPKLTKLDEVSIVSQKLKPAIEVVRLAIKNIPKNYPKKSFLLQGYYRDYIREVKTNDYGNLIEAAIQIEDRGFNTNDYTTTKIKLEQLRFHPNYNLNRTIYSAYDSVTKVIPHTNYNQSNELAILRGQDPIRNRNKYADSFIQVFEGSFENDYSFNYAASIKTDSVNIYKIVFNFLPTLDSEEKVDFQVEGEIFIEEENYAILKFLYTVNSELPNFTGKFLEINMEYKKHLTKYYLNYLSVSNYFEYNSPALLNLSEEPVQYFQFRELFINKIDIKSYRHIRSDEAIRKDVSLINNSIVDRQGFWENYNYPRLIKLLN